MNEAALKALKKSIKHWEEIVGGKDVFWGAPSCALCNEFIEMGCHGCPVRGETGRAGCEETPYDRFRIMALGLSGIGIGGHPNLIALATDELNFLKSLLPKEGEQ